MLTRHVIFDMTGPVQIFYPVSDMKVSIPKINIQSTDDFASGIVQFTGVGMAIYALILFSAPSYMKSCTIRNAGT